MRSEREPYFTITSEHVGIFTGAYLSERSLLGQQRHVDRIIYSPSNLLVTALKV